MANPIMGIDGLPASSETDLGAYLSVLGSLYTSGVTSTESPELLQSIGGILGLAAQDANVVRQRTVLGVLQWPRPWAEQETDAQTRWLKHAAQITSIAKSKKLPPQLAADEYVNDRAFSGVHVQSGEVAREMMTVKRSLDLREATGPRWLLRIRGDRERWANESSVMYGQWLGALTEGVLELRGVDRTRAMIAGAMGASVGAIGESFGPNRNEPVPVKGWKRQYDRGTRLPEIRPELVEQAREAAGLPPPAQPAGRKGSRLPELLTSPDRPSAVDRATLRPFGVVTKGSEREWIYPSPPRPRTSTPQASGPPRGGKREPPRHPMDHYVAGFLEMDFEGKISRSDGTRRGLEDIFQRAHGISEEGRNLVYTKPRAAAMELQAVVREMRDPSVVRIEVIPPTNKYRTPDLLVTRSVGGVLKNKVVEVTAITRSTVSSRPTRGRQAPRQDLADGAIGDRILSKTATRSGRFSQLQAGGKLVVNVMFETFEGQAFTDLAQAEMLRIGEALRTRPWAEEVDIVGIDGRKGPSRDGMRVLEFRRQPNGSYALFNSP